MVIFSPNTKEQLKKAVDLYCENESQALEKYGPINSWDTSLITDMSDLFKNCYNFNDDISNWDVSNVRDMSNMFYGAISFNKPLNNWNVSNVKNMCGMFYPTPYIVQ